LLLKVRGYGRVAACPSAGGGIVKGWEVVCGVLCVIMSCFPLMIGAKGGLSEGVDDGVD